MRIGSRLVGAALSAVCVLAVVVVPVATSTAHTDSNPQTGWHFVEPDLQGPLQWWYYNPDGAGSGWNRAARYTYGIGGDDDGDNYAVWEMGHRNGYQHLAVLVPRSHATATVSYRVYLNDKLTAIVAKIDQQARCSEASTITGRRCRDTAWLWLGNYVTEGADVRIEVWDHETDEHWSRDGGAASKIGVSTIAMKCYRECDDDSQKHPDGDDSDKGNRYPLVNLPTGETDFVHGQSDYPHKAPGLIEGPGAFGRCNDSSVRDSVYRTRGDGYSIGQCTSYVAWRLRQNGIPFVNWWTTNDPTRSQWPGTGDEWHDCVWGNAHNWDNCAIVNDMRVDQNPAAGSVMVFEPGYSGIISSWGHVAYVEEVLSDGRIRIADANGFGAGTCKAGTSVIVLPPATPEPKHSFIHFEDYAKRLACCEDA